MNHFQQPINPDAGHSSHLRLWQLISPALPIGAFSYSQALESAVELQWVYDEHSCYQWISGLLRNNMERLDAPIFKRLYQAWLQNDNDRLHYWNAQILAMRESAELLAEDLHLGTTLCTLISDLGIAHAETWRKDDKSYLTMFSLACCHWRIEIEPAIEGFIWAWCENQISAAIKLIPLGQTAGQRILSQLIPKIHSAQVNALRLHDDDIGSIAAGMSIASALHETQYSRLFRS